MRNICLQCLTNLPGRYTEEPAHRNGGQCILHVITADKVGIHLELLSLVFPTQNEKKRSTSAQLAADIKSLSSFHTITNTGKTLRDSCEILIVLVYENNMLAIVTQMLIQLTFSLDDPSKDPKPSKCALPTLVIIP